MRRRTIETETGTKSSARGIAIIAAALACAAGAALLMRGGGGASRPAVAPPEAEEVAAADPVTAAPAPQAAADPAPALERRRRGITWGDPAAGALADPAAPRWPLALCRERRDATLRKFRETTVDFDFQDNSLRDIVTEIARRWDLSIALDPGVENRSHLSCSMAGADAESALGFLTEFAGLAFVVDSNGDAWVVPADKRGLYEPREAGDLTGIEGAAARARADLQPAQPSAHELAARKQLEETRFTPEPGATTLEAAWKQLWESTGTTLNIDRASIPNPQDIPLEFSGTNVSVREALDTALSARGLEWRFDNGVPTVMTAAAAKAREEAATAAEKARVGRLEAEAEVFGRSVALEGEGLSIRDVAERISKALDIGYRVDEATWGRAARYGFDGEKYTLKEVFEALGKGAPVQVVYRDGVLWYLAR